MTAAAAALRTNVATVSRRIERAGEDLGSPLFQKEGGSWAVTASGRAFIAVAEEFEANLQREENNLGEKSSDQVTTINVAAPPVIVSTILLPALPDLMRAEPLMNVTLTNRTNGHGLGEADIFLRWGAPESGRLVARRVGSMSFRAYRLKSSASPDWAALTHELDSSPITQLGFELFDRPPRLRSSIFDHKVKAMCNTGLAGIVPDAICGRVPELELIPEHADARVNMVIWYAYHASRREDTKLQKAVQWLASAVARACQQGPEFDGESNPQDPDCYQF